MRRKLLLWLIALVLLSLSSLIESHASEVGDEGAVPVELRIGAEHFRIPRNYLETIYSPLSEPQNIIMMPIYYPDFTPAHGDQRPRLEGSTDHPVDHLLSISLIPLSDDPWIPVETQFENEARVGSPVRKLEPAPFGLLEIYDSFTPDKRGGGRSFVAEVDGKKIRIQCTDHHPLVPGVVDRCQYKFPFLDLSVSVAFGQSSLADWLRIYRQSLSLLKSFKEN